MHPADATLETPTALHPSHRQLTAGRILLAEDDPEMRRLLSSALRKQQYEVIEAADGKELIDRLSESMVADDPVDCIITDVRMPRLTGTHAMRLIRNAGLEMPVIVITAFGDYTTRIEASLNGAAVVLDKPFELDDLLRVIRSLHERPR